jgi:hypothetical protein
VEVACEHGNETWYSINSTKFRDYLWQYLFLKKGFSCKALVRLIARWLVSWLVS